MEFDSGCVLESLQKSSSLYVVSDKVEEEISANLAGVQARAAETNASKILTEAYALAEGESLSYESTLTGKITSIDSPYSSQYKNISVWIEVAGHADKPILCYRLKGEGAETLAVDDTITVTGTIKNYYGKIEFDAGCTLDKVVSGGGEAAVAPEDPKQIVDEAFALDPGASLAYSAKLTGKITEINTPYDETYKNITVTIEVEGTTGKKTIECYRLKGTGAETLKVGDTIVVEGIIKRYVKTDAETGDVVQDKIEFNAPSLIEINPVVTPQPTNNKLYCQAPADWTECYIYTWDTNNAATTGDWPGSLMNNEGNGLWSYEVPEAAANVIFNNGAGAQTGDMAKPTDSKIKYVYDTATWEELNVGGEGDEDDVPSTTNEIIDAAYALESGETLDGTYTLSGEVSSVDTPYDSYYENITVTIKVPGSEDKPIQCYRLKGEGADGLAVGDYITVTGSLTNYNGKVQFAQGCTLDKVIKGENEAPKAPEDPKQIVDEAYALAGGESLPYSATLTGKITEVVEAYSEDYKNITVKIAIEGREDKPIVCYRMKGEGVEALKVGDTITVTGTLKNYVKTDSETGETTSTIEFTPCTLVSVGENNQGGNSGNNSGDNSGNTGNNSGNTGSNSGNTGNTGSNSSDKAPGTGDYSLIAPIIVMMMSAACLVVLSRKKFYN